MDEKKVLGDDTAFEPVGRVDCSGDGNVHQRSSTMDSSNLNLKDSHKEEAPNSDYVCNEEKRRQKINRILLAVKLRNYDEVASLATSHGGFIEDETRRVVWPFLLGCRAQTDEWYNGKDGYDNDNFTAEDIVYQQWQACSSHPDEDQVKLDVNRAFVYYPVNKTDAELDARKAALQNLIFAVLRKHPSLHYFQGYHDIASVLLLVLGDGKERHRNSNSKSIKGITSSVIGVDKTGDAAETGETAVSEMTAQALARLSLLRIRDFMLPTLDAALAQLALLPAVLRVADPALAQHLTGMQPFYALAGTLTMYAHEIQSYGDIARLFDYLLAREAVLSIYLFAVTLLRRRKVLLELADPAELHAILSHLPSPLDLESLVRESHELYTCHPPSTLYSYSFSTITSSSSACPSTSSPVAARTVSTFPVSFPFPIPFPFSSGWSSIPASSALKTTRHLPGLALQSTGDGETWLAELEEQVKERKRREEMWVAAQRKLRAWRRPALGVGMAVAVAVLAVTVAGAGRRSGAGAGGGGFGGYLPL